MLQQVICLDGAREGALGYDALLAAGPLRDLPPVGPRDVASLQYTSGTTGFPKGALLTHEGMLTVGWHTGSRMALAAGDRWTSIIPLFHCAGCIMSLLGCLQRGACYVGLPAFDPVAMFETIEQERCTHLSGVPTSFLAMLEHPDRLRFDLSSLRGGTCGGADANPAVLRRCVEGYPIPELIQVYGQTEASTLVAAAGHDDPRRLDTAGLPLPSFEVRITDPETRDLAGPEEIGQIEARGPCIMRGYYNKREETADVLDADGWLQTGDLGRLTSDGRLQVAGGRLRDMIIRGGENIYPVEIENLLLTHSGITQVAVFGLPDDYYGEIVAAAVAVTPNVTSAELTGHCQGRIAGFKIPARFFAITEFPMTASGKIRKGPLRDAAGANKLKDLP